MGAKGAGVANGALQSLGWLRGSCSSAQDTQAWRAPRLSQSTANVLSFLSAALVQSGEKAFGDSEIFQCFCFLFLK